MTATLLTITIYSHAWSPHRRRRLHGWGNGRLGVALRRAEGLAAAPTLVPLTALATLLICLAGPVNDESRAAGGRGLGPSVIYG